MIEDIPKSPTLISLEEFLDKMKTLLIIITFFLMVSGTNEYCSGFKSGWDDGSCCDVSYDCVAPPPPPCPIPVPGKDTFNDGYGTGYKMGCENTMR